MYFISTLGNDLNNECYILQSWMSLAKLLEGGKVGSGWHRREAGSALTPLRALSKGDLGQLPRRPGTGARREGTGPQPAPSCDREPAGRLMKQTQAL